MIVRLIFALFSPLIADEFFKDLESDLKKRSASKSSKPKSLWEELAVSATFTPSINIILMSTTISLYLFHLHPNVAFNTGM